MRLRARRGPTWGDHLRFLHALRIERGLLFVQLAPVLLGIGYVLRPANAPSWILPAQAGGAGLLAVAGVLLSSRPRSARGLALAGIAATIAPFAPRVLIEPELLVLGSVGLWAIGHLVVSEPSIAVAAASPMPSAARTARIASVMALAAWFIDVLVLGRRDLLDMTLAASSVLVASSMALRWVLTARGVPWARVAVSLAMVGGALGAWANRGWLPLAVSCLAVIPLVTAIAVPRAAGEETALPPIIEHPARLLVVTFIGLCVSGGIVLSLPIMSADGHSIGFLDAVFTATSAVCVTGLGVRDTATEFSTYGHVAILILIQIGGLGIMTFYTVALAALGRRLSLRHERAVAGAANIEDRRRLVSSLWRILGVTAVSELIGASVLAGAFYVEGDGVGMAIWRGVFTAVSGFCNAGFGLQSDNLVGYQHAPIVLWTVALLMIVGGLSPAGVFAFPKWIRGKRVRLQERLILTTEVGLLITATVLFASLEWSVSLADLSWMDRIHNAFFQAATLRTAGFNSVDLTITRPATQTLMIVLMFLGGGPGGTAGGVKTTTTSIIVFMVVATLRGRAHVEAFGRRIGVQTVFKAAAIITVAALACLTGLLALELTQQRIGIELASFEVVSALGTSGLTIGATPLLDAVGKIIIIACMFAGRVGPLTLFMFLAEQENESPVSYPEEEVEVG